MAFLLESKVGLSSLRKVSPALLWGVIYLLVLAVLVWVLYGARVAQVKYTEQKTASLKEEVLSQINEEDLNLLETQIGRLSALYGRPIVSATLKEIRGVIPKVVRLTSVSLGPSGTLNLSGRAPDYRSVALFVYFLNEQTNHLQKVEITRTSRATREDGSVEIEFNLQGHVK